MPHEAEPILNATRERRLKKVPEFRAVSLDGTKVPLECNKPQATYSCVMGCSRCEMLVRNLRGARLYDCRCTLPQNKHTPDTLACCRLPALVLPGLVQSGPVGAQAKVHTAHRV
ncbi:hypothetical protein AURDEDRAFT_131901 [Auricularia subglabra TFB-10046 SS5]|uniref:Uncharacterized protein n=1 Tax=Auricularia subglabra (strain TFB-10046 / SS5) TaxID=717982 RepID=J0WMG6_AURST|nr:hypothetical protein AURDEDRAFT_131901 [Auricularia subglabra TFB-10046 SS5]